MLNTQSASRLGRRGFAALLGVVLAGPVACGHLHRGDEVDVRPAMVVFENQSLDQADVYVIRSANDSRRIGTVMAGRTDTLEVPHDVINGGTVNIVARLLARSITPQTGPVSIVPGDWLRVTLPADERMLAVLGMSR